MCVKNYIILYFVKYEIINQGFFTYWKSFSEIKQLYNVIRKAIKQLIKYSKTENITFKDSVSVDTFPLLKWNLFCNKDILFKIALSLISVMIAAM